jgi:hypothetical protein
MGSRSPMAVKGEGGLMDDTLCLSCLRREEVADGLRGADLTPEEWCTIRRRIEEGIRKSPAALFSAVVALAAEGHIRIEDLV